MHRSRLYGIFIDTPDADADEAAAFWSGVFGVTAVPEREEPQFITLPGAVPGLTVDVQRIGGGEGPRYHVDLETDDVDAETARLLALGATEINRWLGCRILRAPGGHVLCVVPVHSDPALFDAEARTWE
mgnify:CR=1 FL=1